MGVYDVLELLRPLHPVLQALLATTFSWFITMIEAAAIFVVKWINVQLPNSMLGFSAGVMAVLDVALGRALQLKVPPTVVPHRI
jgi:zinc transporter ZupT